jgi:hypothetical protein
VFLTTATRDADALVVYAYRTGGDDMLSDQSADQELDGVWPWQWKGRTASPPKRGPGGQGREGGDASAPRPPEAGPEAGAFAPVPGRAGQAPEWALDALFSGACADEPAGINEAGGRYDQAAPPGCADGCRALAGMLAVLQGLRLTGRREEDPASPGWNRLPRHPLRGKSG